MTSSIRIQKQVSLSFMRILEICVNGIYHRLFRAMVTLAIVSVAVAFMMYMLSSSVIGRNAYRHAQAEARGFRTHDRWVTWLSGRMATRNWIGLLAQAAPDDMRLAALRRWSDLPPATFDEVLSTAAAVDSLVAFIEDLPPGKQFVLLQDKGDVFLADWLADANRLAQFLRRMADLGDTQWRQGASSVRAVLERYEMHREAIAGLQTRRLEAVRSLNASYSGRPAADLLMEPPPDLPATLARLGFVEQAEAIDPVLASSAYNRDLRIMGDLLRSEDMKRSLAGELKADVMEVSVTDLCRLCDSPSGAASVVSRAQEAGIELPFQAERMQEVAEWALRRDRIFEVETAASQFSGGRLGFSLNMLWLIGVSCLVCVVGIANAMLMSVVERFREIATIKCLGGTDSFVMILFVIESLLQGVVGGLAGAVLGFLLAVPISLARYGMLTWRVLPPSDLAMVGVVSLAAGMLLSALASVYPASVASRLAPMEAMRVE